MNRATVWAAGALCRPQTLQHAAALGSRSTHHVLGMQHCWLRNGLRLPLAARLGCKPRRQASCQALGSGSEPSSNDTPGAAAEHSAAAVGDSLLPVDVCVPYCPLQFGEQLSLVGSCAELGGWDASAAPLLQWQEGDDWVATLSLPPGEHACKLVLVRQDGSLHWEEGEDRALVIPANAGSATVSMRFGFTGAIEVRALPRAQPGIPQLAAAPGPEPAGHPATAVGTEPPAPLPVVPGLGAAAPAAVPAAGAAAPLAAEPPAPAGHAEHGQTEAAHLEGEAAGGGAEAFAPEADVAAPAAEPETAARVQQLAQAKLELSARIMALQEEVQQSDVQIASRRRQVQEMVQSELARLTGGQAPQATPPQPAGAAEQAQELAPAAAAAEAAGPGSKATAGLAAEAAGGEEAVPAGEPANERDAAAEAVEPAVYEAAVAAAGQEASGLEAGAAWQAALEQAPQAGAQAAAEPEPEAPAAVPAAARHGVPVGSPAIVDSVPAPERSPSPRPASSQERQKLQQAAARAAAAAAAAAARLQRAAAVARGAAPPAAVRAPPPPPVQALAEAQPEQQQVEGQSPHWQEVEDLPAQHQAQEAAADSGAAEAPAAAEAAGAASAAAKGEAAAAPVPGVLASAEDGAVVFSFDAAATQRSAQELAQQLLQLPPEAAAALERRLRPANLQQNNGRGSVASTGSDSGSNSSTGGAGTGKPPLSAIDAAERAGGSTPRRDVQASALGRSRRCTPGAVGSRSCSAARGSGGLGPVQRPRRAGRLSAARGASSGRALTASRRVSGEGEEELQKAQQPPRQQQVKAGSVSVPAQVPQPGPPQGGGPDSEAAPTAPPPAVAPASPAATETPLVAEPQQAQQEEVLRLFDVSDEGPAPPRQRAQRAGGEVLRLFDSGATGGQPPGPAGPPRRLPLSWSYPASPGWALEENAFRRPSAPLACLFLVGEAAFGVAHLLWDTGRSAVPPGPARVVADVAFWAAAGAALASPWL